MIYCVHVAVSCQREFFEELFKFNSEDEYNSKKEELDHWDNGLSHYLKKLTFEEYYSILEEGRKAMESAYRFYRFLEEKKNNNK